MSAVKVFKIRRLSDGLFSRGGTFPSFSKNGKSWSSASAIGSHLHMVDSIRNSQKSKLPDPYLCCEVVVIEIEMIETTRSCFSVEKYKEGITERREARNKRV